LLAMRLTCNQEKSVRIWYGAQKGSLTYWFHKLSRSLKAGHRILAPDVLVRVQPRQQINRLKLLFF
jgi:hypothetical protein